MTNAASKPMNTFVDAFTILLRQWAIQAANGKRRGPAALFQSNNLLL
jgi:hypothetical protein